VNVEPQTTMKVQETVPLLVADINESRKFYCDGLGFLMAQKWDQEGQLAWCRLQHGGAALMLQQSGDDGPPAETRGSGVCFYFICADADVVYREITERGIVASKPVVAFYGMNQTYITDPDGYELCFENPAQLQKDEHPQISI